MQTIKKIFQDRVLRKRILFVVFILVLVRLLIAIQIPFPGIDANLIKNALASNSALAFLGLLSGSGFATVSIASLGVAPYISSSIIFQLLTVLVPRFKEMYHEEGEIGRKKISKYTRILTIPLAFLQSYAILSLVSKSIHLSLSSILFGALIMTTGSFLVIWLGEQINEYGIGNGVSLIIFSGIVASFPVRIFNAISAFDISQLPIFIAAIIIFILVVAGVVYVTESERKIQITYSKQASNFYGSSGLTHTYLPIRLNQSGVMPIIFAVSILFFPQFFVQIFSNSSNITLVQISQSVAGFLNNLWAYGIVYFLLVLIFTYFYTAVSFDVQKVSENLQKGGGFISGYRPGDATENHIAYILNRVTFFGAVFLGLIAILPIIFQGFTGITAFTIGGTSLLIAVSVIIDFIKKVDAQLTMREY